MHRSEFEEAGICAACGASVSLLDRPYLYGEDDLLCFACAEARAGVYDEGHDRWQVAPDVADLQHRVV